MRHARTGKKLGRDSAHRKALYANLAGALIEHGRIKTTITKAKAVKPIAEQMITLGRRGDLHARRQAVAFLRSKDVVHKLFAEVGPQFAERPGGYTRIVRIGPRPGDAAEMAYLELVDTPLVFKTKLGEVPAGVQLPPGVDLTGAAPEAEAGVETEAAAEPEAEAGDEAAAAELPAEGEEEPAADATEPVAEAEPAAAAAAPEPAEDAGDARAES